MLNFSRKNKGFTLIETLVAISILMISVVGPMVFVSNGIRASYYARDQITAFYLAQDAVETLRWLRDNDRIYIIKNSGDPTDPASWPTFNNALITECSDGNLCGIDTLVVQNSIFSLGQSIGSGNIDQGLADTPLYLDSDGYYSYDTSGVETKFKRYFTYTFNGTEISLVVTVKWTSALGGTERRFTVQENLMLWY